MAGSGMARGMEGGLEKLQREAAGALRCADVQAEVIVPAGHIPSARTLGEDLRRRLMGRLYGIVATAEELERQARSAAQGTARTFYVGDELARMRVDASTALMPLSSLECIVTARLEVTP